MLGGTPAEPAMVEPVLIYVPLMSISPISGVRDSGSWISPEMSAAK